MPGKAHMPEVICSSWLCRGLWQSKNSSSRVMRLKLAIYCQKAIVNAREVLAAAVNNPLTKAIVDAREVLAATRVAEPQTLLTGHWCSWISNLAAAGVLWPISKLTAVLLSLF